MYSHICYIYNTSFKSLLVFVAMLLTALTSAVLSMVARSV